ncbi:hypothetical protein CPB86DRAFT_239010 [Serendipita vermifera]|nr:hypothetical protein CPB86DRAFT_239010 [Serendipita vermifera]
MDRNTAGRASTHRKSTRRAGKGRKVGTSSTKVPLAWPGPITSVPNEILSLIFQQYVKKGGIVWDLIPVSKRWERIALDTRSLWSSILVQTRTSRNKSVKEFIYNNDPEYYKKTEGPFTGDAKSQYVCFELRHLSKAISRTGESLLDIEISFRSRSALNRSSLNSLIEMLLEPAISARIRSLELYIDWPMFPTMRTNHFDHASLLNLRQLKIRLAPKDWIHNLLRSISANTRKLEVMHCFAEEPIDQYLSDRILNQIRVFNHGWPNMSEGFDGSSTNSLMWKRSRLFPLTGRLILRLKVHFDISERLL